MYTGYLSLSYFGAAPVADGLAVEVVADGLGFEVAEVGVGFGAVVLGLACAPAGRSWLTRSNAYTEEKEHLDFSIIERVGEEGARGSHVPLYQ